jgi:polysaccharide export outer membrane protein
MNVLISLLVATLLMQRAPVAAPRAQQPGQPGPAPTAPATDAPSQAKYQIGPQDLLKVTVLDEAELSQNYRVDSDGTISFPYIGRIPAAGSTLSALQDLIRSKLAAGYIKNPQVRVEVESYKSQAVMVSGEVRQPGKFSMTGQMTVLEALAQAGSPTTSASNELTIARKKPGAETADSDLLRINWKDLQLGRGTDVALQDGDILNIPKAQTFYITGQVRNPQNYVLDPGMTVQQAIALAGGLTERGSDRRITASRLVKGKLTDVGLKMEDKVMPNDVITIGQRLF